MKRQHVNHETRPARMATRRWLALSAIACITLCALSAAGQVNIEPFQPKGAEALASPLPTDSTVGGNTGAVTLSFPIDAPPGPGGFQPDLALAYSSNGSDGFFGVGWDVQLSEISCSTRFGVPNYSACPRYELDGELLTYDGGMFVGAAYYHTLVESFQRIVHDKNDNTWTATAIDGTTWRFGTSSASRIHLDGDDNAPAARWLLAEIENTFGQKICFYYDSSDLGTAYPSTITYAHENACSSPKRKIEFVYESRPDPIRSYAGGVERAALKRAIEIRVLSLVNGSWQPFRRRVLTYAAAGQYTTGRSRLASTQLFGSDCSDLSMPPAASASCSAQPAESFTYSDYDPSGAQWMQFEHPTDPEWVAPVPFTLQRDNDFGAPPPVQSAAMRSGDVNGDGLIDFVTTGSGTGSVPWSPQAPFLTPGAVFINTGSGWQPDTGWTDAFNSLTYEAFVVTGQVVESEHAGYPGKNALGVCSVETWLSNDPQVPAPVTLGNAGLALSKALDHTVDAPRTIGSFDHYKSRQSIAAGNGPLAIPTSHVEVFPSFYLVDLDGDGLDDWVASVEVSGVHISVNCDGTVIDLGSIGRSAKHTLRVAFRNTGRGWEPDPALVANMPGLELTIVESEDYLARKFGGSGGVTQPVNEGYCPDFGMIGGAEGVWVGDFCVNNVSLSPLFQDLDSDGRSDLIVSKRSSEDEPAIGVPVFSNGIFIPEAFSPTRSQAWLNKPGGWVRAPQFDPPVAHVTQGQYLGDTALPSVPRPRSETIDNAVRIADLNADGLPDISFTASAIATPPVSTGVLLNRGRGDGTRYSAWCASEPYPIDMDLDGVADGPVIPACPHARRYLPPRAFTRIVGENSSAGTFLNLADINGDGWPDYFQADDRDEWGGPSVGMWSRFHDPASPLDPSSVTSGSAWLPEDPAEHFEPPIPLNDPPPASGVDWLRLWGVSGVLPFDANGDGAVDFIRGSYDAYTGTSEPLVEFAAFISNESLPDLLLEYDNGRGGVTQFTYRTGSSQRDEALGTLALTHASEAGIDEQLTYPDPAIAPLAPNGFNVRWTKRPVVASVTQFGPNLPAAGVTSNFEWSHPRWCAEHRSEFGYRLARSTRPDGSTVDRFYFQKHGRAGKISRAVLRDAQGQAMFVHNEDWEIVEAPIPGTVQLDIIYGQEVVVGRLVSEESSNQYAGGSGALHSRTLEYDDAHGYNFISRATFGRETGDLYRHFEPRPLTNNEELRWLRNLVLREMDSTSPDAGATGEILAQSSYSYSSQGALIAREDLLRRRDGSGAETSVVTARGYDAFGNVSFVNDPNGNRTEFCYDGDVGAVPWCPDDFGQATHSAGVAMKDALGNISTYEPDPISGEIIEVRTAMTDEPDLLLLRDAFDRVIQERALAAGSDSNGFVRKDILYDDDAYPAPIVDEISYADRLATAATSVTKTTIADGFGGVWKSIRRVPAGYVGTFVFRDPANNSLLESYPTACADDLCSAFVGDEGPSVLTATETVFDPLGRPLSIVRPGTEISVFAYSAATQVQPAGDGNGVQFDRVFAKNAKGGLNQRLLDGDRVVWADECSNSIAAGATSLAGVSCSAPERTFYTYQASGEIAAVYDAIATATADYVNESHRLAYHYDTLGRVRAIDDPNLLQAGAGESGTTYVDYDLAGNEWKRWNGRGEMTERLYDALNRPTWVFPPAGESIVQMTYRPDERQPATVTTDLAQNGATGTYSLSFRYDELGRVVRKQVEGSYWRSRSLLLDFAYDELGRPVDIVYPDDETIVHYDYVGAHLSGVCEVPALGDDCSHTAAVHYLESVGYDAIGRRESVVSPAGTRTYQYDAVTQRLTQDAYTGRGGNYGRTLDFAYDPLGNLREIATPNGPLQDPAIDFAASYTYDSHNRLESWRHGGTTYGYAYDALGNLTHHEVVGAPVPNQEFAHPTKPNAITARPNANPALDKTYSYDADGNLATEATAAGGVRHFDFDAQNRLTCVGTSAGGCQIRVVSYDVNGTRIRDRRPQTNTDRYFADDYFSLDVDVRSNANTGAEVRIFAAGEQIARKLIRTPRLRSEPLLALPWPGVVVRPTAEGVALVLSASALLLLVGACMLAETARSQPITSALAAAITLSLVFPPGLAFGFSGLGPRVERQWFLNDHLSSANVWLDRNGRGVMRVVYTPFGKVHRQSTAAANRIFAGHPLDDATGLHYMKARWHNAETGTFLSIDALVANETDPQSYNAYAYARNNPIALVDPAGTKPIGISTGGGPNQSNTRGLKGRVRYPGDTHRGAASDRKPRGSTHVEEEDVGHRLNQVRSDAQPKPRSDGSADADDVKKAGGLLGAIQQFFHGKSLKAALYIAVGGSIQIGFTGDGRFVFVGRLGAGEQVTISVVETRLPDELAGEDRGQVAAGPFAEAGVTLQAGPLGIDLTGLSVEAGISVPNLDPSQPGRSGAAAPFGEVTGPSISGATRGGFSAGGSLGGQLIFVAPR